jgi:hypothetical protein
MVHYLAEDTPMTQLALRTPDDVRRLFSALGDDLTHETGALSVADIDQLSLSGDLDMGVATEGLGLTLLVAMLTAWVAIKGYERNQHQMGWGLGWGALGFMFPLPSAIYSAVKE